MAKSHPAQFDHHRVSRNIQWVRTTVASFVLLASLLSLSIILHSHYGTRFAAAMADGIAALDLTQYLPKADAAPEAVDPNQGKYRAIGEYLARRYRVSMDVTTGIVAKAHDIGQELKLDPMLILAVIAVESRFNPIAESTMGAKGLMQVIPRFHQDKFDLLGGEKMAFEPAANIMVGARILKDYMRFTGDLGGALQMYVGATTVENENGYSSKVILERDRLNQVLSQYQNRAAQQAPAAGASAT